MKTSKDILQEKTEEILKIEGNMWEVVNNMTITPQEKMEYFRKLDIIHTYLLEFEKLL